VTAGAAALALGGKNSGRERSCAVAVCACAGAATITATGLRRSREQNSRPVCDVDESVSSKRIGEIEEAGLPKPKSYVDVRKLLEDKDIDAISIVTPNHWDS